MKKLVIVCTIYLESVWRNPLFYGGGGGGGEGFLSNSAICDPTAMKLGWNRVLVKNFSKQRRDSNLDTDFYF